jgi:putative transposase
MKHVVGIDMGLSSFATLSDGTAIPNPRFFRLEEKELAKAQRKLSTATKGSPERKKAVGAVQRVHERIANKRYNFIHQLSRRLVDDYTFIAFEDLNIKNMLKNHCLAKSISDAAWNMLISATKYKAESAGSIVALVNPANTSKMCPRCGLLVEKTLADRTHKCNSCGLVLDRDHNAAINILRLGLQSVGIETVEAHAL